MVFLCFSYGFPMDPTFTRPGITSGVTCGWEHLRPLCWGNYYWPQAIDEYVSWQNVGRKPLEIWENWVAKNCRVKTLQTLQMAGCFGCCFKNMCQTWWTFHVDNWQNVKGKMSLRPNGSVMFQWHGHFSVPFGPLNKSGQKKKNILSSWRWPSRCVNLLPYDHIHLVIISVLCC